MSEGSVVEELLEPSITPTKLLQASQVLSQVHYADVVEERNILHLCGYPLCDKTISQIQQKYHISVTRRQVIDLTERKKFCSNNCFKKSKCFSSQLPVQPLKGPCSTVTVVKLLECTGSEDDNVDQHSSQQSVEDEQLEKIPWIDKTDSNIKMSTLKKLELALSTWHSNCGTSDGEHQKYFLHPMEQRRRIVVHQLSRCLSTVCAELDVNYHEAYPSIIGLINTFRLERNCITFHPKEWKVLVTVLLIECGLIESAEELIKRQRKKLTEWLTDIQASIDDLCTMIKFTARTDKFNDQV